MNRHALEPGFVADGDERLEISPAYQASLQRLRQSIVDRYAKQLASASWLERQYVCWCIDREYRAELRRIAPSPYSLF